jgi:hypothetical protein
LVLCVPNAQHWSVIGRLASGDFVYEESGLLDKTHIRWFTKKTLIQLIENAGFFVDGGVFIHHKNPSDALIKSINDFASNYSPASIVDNADFLAWQYVLRVRPR